jgi:hypothetical protein
MMIALAVIVGLLIAGVVLFVLYIKIVLIFFLAVAFGLPYLVLVFLIPNEPGIVILLTALIGTGILVAMAKYGEGDNPLVSRRSNETKTSDPLTLRLLPIVGRFKNCGAWIDSTVSDQLAKELKDLKGAFEKIASEYRQMAGLLEYENKIELANYLGSRASRHNEYRESDRIRAKVLNVVNTYDTLLWAKLPEEGRAPGCTGLALEWETMPFSPHAKAVDVMGSDMDQSLTDAIKLLESKPGLLSRAFKAIKGDDSYRKSISDLSQRMRDASGNVAKQGHDLVELVLSEVEKHASASVQVVEKPGFLERFLGHFRKSKQARLA